LRTEGVSVLIMNKLNIHKYSLHSKKVLQKMPRLDQSHWPHFIESITAEPLDWGYQFYNKRTKMRLLQQSQPNSVYTQQPSYKHHIIPIFPSSVSSSLQLAHPSRGLLENVRLDCVNKPSRLAPSHHQTQDRPPLYEK
jgi:hypothetical protein